MKKNPLDLATKTWSGSIELDFGDLCWLYVDAMFSYSQDGGTTYFESAHFFIPIDIKTPLGDGSAKIEITHLLNDSLINDIFEEHVVNNNQ